MFGEYYCSLSMDAKMFILKPRRDELDLKEYELSATIGLSAV